MNSAMKKQIEIVPYDPNWARLFEVEGEVLRKAFSYAVCKAHGENCLNVYATSTFIL